MEDEIKHLKVSIKVLFDQTTHLKEEIEGQNKTLTEELNRLKMYIQTAILAL